MPESYRDPDAIRAAIRAHHPDWPKDKVEEAFRIAVKGLERRHRRTDLVAMWFGLIALVLSVVTAMACLIVLPGVIGNTNRVKTAQTDITLAQRDANLALLQNGKAQQRLEVAQTKLNRTSTRSIRAICALQAYAQEAAPSVRRNRLNPAAAASAIRLERLARRLDRLAECPAPAQK